MRRHFPQEQEAWLKDVFAGLDSQTLNAIRDAGRYVELDAGDRVADVHEVAVRVESGLIKLAVTSDDRSLTIGLFGPNDTILSPLFHTWDVDLYYLEAQEPTEVRIIPQKALLEIAAANPKLNYAIMEQLSWGNWQMMNTIHMLAFFNLPQRVAQVLLNLATMFGRPDEKGGIRLGLRFTQEELAELAGARRETLSTVLQDFREEGILDLRYARIDIKDIDALRKLAGADPIPFLQSPKLVF